MTKCALFLELVAASTVGAIGGGVALGLECGPLGEIAGALLGAIGGPVLVGFSGCVVALPTTLPHALRFLVRRRMRRRQLRPYFGDYWKPARRAWWLAAKERIRPGDVVHGHLVAVLEEELVVDLGCGFPAVISKLLVSPPDGDRVDGLPVLPGIGETIAANVVEAFDDAREIDLSMEARS